MEPILDETTLVPCPVRPPGTRIGELARTLQALDIAGAARVLRSVRDAADRDLGDGRGLRAWCFDRATSRDAGRFVAGRLSAQPFIDGADGLFAAAEGRRAVEAALGNVLVVGVGLAALIDGLVVLLASDARPIGERLDVELTFVDADELRRERIQVRTYACAKEVEDNREALLRQMDATLNTGTDILRRLSEVFPKVLLGDHAREQIERLTGAEPVFRQLVRHLRALNEGAVRWEDGKPYEPVAVTYSVESKATLEDGSLGPMRDFPTPAGFTAERWSLHTKLTGGNGARLYFRAVREGERALVLVGYFGNHLPTVRHRA